MVFTYTTIENKNAFHFEYDPQSDPEFVVITMRDGAKIYLPKNNIERSYANIKKQLNRHLKNCLPKEVSA